ncbi:HalOD1 output domain-containing protein [Halomarina litorea]|uniref:HalOD1 output domain-containing protein n=1 Tax=Halomarina litorea TaxID=2961595 RepID=UPI002113A0FF|nr:HalOD1 output domain-containing protein [Halomarina sp. BCD28]
MNQGTDQISPSVAVIEHVADHEGTDPLELSPPLHDVIDPDALDRLCTGTDSAGHVAFSYCGYLVTVTTDGDVSLEERAHVPASGADQTPAASAASD